MTNMFCDDEVKPIKGMMFPKLYRDPQGLKDMHRGIAGHLGIEGGAAPQMEHYKLIPWKGKREL